MTLDADQRRALAVLADTGRDGAGKAIMAARFEVEVLAGLERPRMGERGSRNGARTERIAHVVTHREKE